MCSASVIRAFHSVQPRPRAQVALSSRRAARKASRLFPLKRIHAIARSHEESPAPEVPKSRSPEVDDGAQPAVFDQQVSLSNVPVEPDGRAVPRSLEGRFPHRARHTGVDLAVEGGNGLPGFSVVDRQRSAAEEVVPPGRGATGGIDLIQGGQELAQPGREPAQIGDVSGGRGLAFESPVDGPLPGITVGRSPLR